MGEIKRFYICHDPIKVDGSHAHLFESPTTQDEEQKIAQLGPVDDGGWDIHGLFRVYFGTKQSVWEKEHTKVYDDFASAKADAEKRLAKVRKQYEAKKKMASGSLTGRVAARFQAAVEKLDKAKIKRWMQQHVHEYEDRKTGEVNATEMAEAAANEFNAYEDKRDYKIPEEVFDLAADVGGAHEKTYK